MYSQIFIVSLIVIPGLCFDKNCKSVSDIGRKKCSRFPKYIRFYQTATCHSNEYITKSKQVSCKDDPWITCTLDMTGRAGGFVHNTYICKKETLSWSKQDCSAIVPHYLIEFIRLLSEVRPYVSKLFNTTQ